MATVTVTYDGFMYQIEHKPELSTRDYTQRSVYHIKTKDKDFSHAHRAVEIIMADGSWRKGIWQTKYKKQPTMANALHTYHEFIWNRKLGVYVYTHVRPYDD